LWDRLAHWARGYGSTSDTDDAQGAP
jgi:hypothetical protein